MKTKEELIDRILSRVQDEPFTELLDIFKEELPDYDPRRIDEERLIKIWGESEIHSAEQAIFKYNSTLPEEFPVWINEKPELPDVTKLADLIGSLYSKLNSNYEVAQHIIDTYALHSQKREWWMDCEYFVYNGVTHKKDSHRVYPDGGAFLYSGLNILYDVKDCTPYIEPSMTEQLYAMNVTEEQIQQLLKERGK